jgi:hypothetical protein
MLMKQVLVYVRLPKNRDKNYRIVTFDLPAEISHDDIFALGGAIDGHQALFEVESPLKNKALLTLERGIVALLKRHEYAVDFK